MQSNVGVIINCGDNDREGEVLVNNIIYDIFKKNEISKPVKRILLPDLAEKTIKDELDNLRDIKDTENWYNEGLARTYIDWIYGINFSRFVSLKTNNNFAVGRVIVPTVKFLYDRDVEIKNFKSEKYLVLEGIIQKDGKEVRVEFQKVKPKEGLFEIEKESMLIKAKEICKGKITVSDILEKDVVRKPKKLFSLKTLQNFMFSKFKIKISNTLENAQALYEKAYTTYPRTNSEYLTNEEKIKIKNLVEKLQRNDNLNIAMKEDKRIFDSQKVESHSAIIITGNKVNKESLNDIEMKTYNAIRNRFLANFCKDECLVKEQTIIFNKLFDDNEVFIEGKLKGIAIIQKGYLEFENDLSEKDIPNFTKGEEIDIKFEVKEKELTPPSKVTEAELNNFYENPFKKNKVDNTDELTDDEDYKAIMEGVEIGTPATRASIIEKVKKDGYVIENKNCLEITDKGVKLIEILEQLEVNLYKEKTVEISRRLKEIYNNRNTLENVLTNVKEEVRHGINKDIQIEKFGNTSIGKCPICNSLIIENSKSYYCENWKKCGFSIWKQMYGKRLNKTDLIDLLENGITKEIKGFKSKAGKSFSAKLIIDGGKVNLRFDSNKKHEF